MTGARRISSRIPRDLRANRWSRAFSTPGAVRHDLTATNPTAVGLDYPEGLLDSLRDPGGLRYRPEPRGLASARRAVAAVYAERGVELTPERIVLTAGTSEAYALLLKLLGDPGAAVLLPRPSYPLLEHLARLEGLQPLDYPLDPVTGWQPAPDALERDAAVVVAVHPNNPTGSLLGPETFERLGRCPATPIVDEVFLDYPLTGGVPVSAAALLARPGFVLGGLSKSAGLPQLKLAWIATIGPDAEIAPLLEGLEFAADQYLSVSTPVQLALPSLLRRSGEVRARILDRCRGNVVRARAALTRSGISLLEPEAGWSAVLRIPVHVDEERLAVELIEHDAVALYPGFFFDFERPGYVVVSLLAPPESLEAGLAALVRRVELADQSTNT